MDSIAGVLGYPDLLKGIPRSPVREPILEEAQFTPGEKKHRDPCPRPIKPRHERHAVWDGRWDFIRTPRAGKRQQGVARAQASTQSSADTKI